MNAIKDRIARPENRLENHLKRASIPRTAKSAGGNHRSVIIGARDNGPILNIDIIFIRFMAQKLSVTPEPNGATRIGTKQPTSSRISRYLYCALTAKTFAEKQFVLIIAIAITTAAILNVLQNEGGVTVTGAHDDGGLMENGRDGDYCDKIGQQTSYGSGLEAMDLCEIMFGYWPCLDKIERQQRDHFREICDQENRRDPWKLAAEYLFGSPVVYEYENYHHLQ
ncbi:hypothetical protein F511_21503 [Dorcoceras hygrometricum]|uniref:Uncharacterized protein n=1 Tax=Dorcoceras hygrometricum TaxID=472368 RepID=A0A2Z7D833_9LAMI|nr:hypothetical protein F511_21503 [Dorcoceras hygrometricum]